jgi:hypothetical protein
MYSTKFLCQVVVMVIYQMRLLGMAGRRVCQQLSYIVLGMLMQVSSVYQLQVCLADLSQSPGWRA